MTEPTPPDVDFAVKEQAMKKAPVGITLVDPDREDNPLVYVNEAFERITGYSRDEVLGRNCRFLQGENTDPGAVDRLLEGINAAEPVTVELLNYRRDGEPFWNEVTVAPIRDASGAVTHYIGFQVDVTQRKQAQRNLSDERERLDRLVDRINGLLIDVTDLLMHGIDRAATEQALVERIAATDAYAATWVGEPDLARDVLVTSSMAGFEEPVDGIEPDLDGDSPVARAYRNATPTVADGQEWSTFPVDGADGQLAAVPLVYGDTNYGVLAVLGLDVDTLDDRELVVLETVGRIIATAINAAQSRRGLTADDLIELEFSVTDPSFFPVALASACDYRFELLGSTATGNGGLRVFLEAAGADSDIEAGIPDVEDVVDVTRIRSGQAELLELDLASGSIFDRLAERGAQIQTLAAESDCAELEILVPPATGGRAILELLEERYEGVELVAYRERERRPTTIATVLEMLERELTERQATALRSAYYSGYYADPRTTSGDELAETMGVSRQTFHEHLRTAERTVLSTLLD
jgi:PAS domain S-box-containing protein